jgi:hypothetical protein
MTDEAEDRLPSRSATPDLAARSGTQVFVLADDPADATAPAVVLLKMPPGYRLFRHAHICHRFEVVVEGTLEQRRRTCGRIVAWDDSTARSR